MKKVEIGIYRTFTEYFARGIKGYCMREIKDNDRYCLALKIKHKLNENKIKKCIVRPLAGGEPGSFFPSNKADLEIIAGEISSDFEKTGLKSKINEKIYVKK